MNYKNHYDRLIEKAKARDKLNGYYECHHIVPKCLGGSDDFSNLVYLTAEEHYVAHQLLVKIYPNVYAISYSALLMTRSTRHTVRSNKMYAWLKVKFSKDCSTFMKNRFSNKFNHPCFNKFGEKHPRFGKKHSEESKKLISAKLTGRAFSDETRKKMSETMKVVFNTAEYKEKISIARKVAFKGNKNPAYGTKMINNGTVRKRIPKNQPVPAGWKIGAVLNKKEF